MSGAAVARTAVLVLALGGVSCASSRITVEKVTADKPDVPGVRYSLPKPFLVVKPNPAGDGTVTVDIVYLPNEDETYAISGRTRRGKYSLVVETKEGLLEKITWNAEGASDINGSAVTTAAELAKAVVDKREADAKAAEDEQEAEEKAARADLKKTQDAVDEKALALKLAELELASAQSVGSPESLTTAQREAVRKAQLERDKAEAELLDAQARLAERQAALAAVSNARDEPPSSRERRAFDQFWGPVIYEIRDANGSVELVPVQWNANPSSYQVQFETITARPDAARAEPPPAAPASNGVSVGRASRDTEGSVVVTLTAPKPVRTVDTDQLLVLDASGTVVDTEASAAIADGSRRVVLTFRSLPAGRYTFMVRGTYADGTPLAALDLNAVVP